MLQTSYEKKAAIRIITSAARDYKNLLEGNNYIFIYKNRQKNCIEYFEAAFLARNFQHLTGLDYIDSSGSSIINALDFYRKCLNRQLKESEIRFKSDGTTSLKLTALPMIINFLKSSKMTALYNGIRPKLAIERIAGTTNFCLGFKYDKCGYYVPSSALLEDIRDLTTEAYQILAILSKPASNKFPIYKDIRYVAKGVTLDKLTMPDELIALINLENYMEKNK